LGREHRDLVVVLVSNNPYALDRPLARGTRPTLGGGQLALAAEVRILRTVTSLEHYLPPAWTGSWTGAG
jgi:hypothetical protein